MIFSTPPKADCEDLAIFVFIDALGWQIFQTHQHVFLDGELQMARPLDTVLGYSCACDPTILTGRMPQDHGHFSFFQFAPERSPFKATRILQWLPKALTSRGRVRRQISKFIAKQKQYTGYFQLYNVPFDRLHWLDYSEKRDLYQPGGILSGAPTIFDHLRERQLPFHLSDWRRTESENLNHLRSDLDQGHIRWAYLYLAGLDGILHRDGTQADSVTAHIRWYDEQLREVLSVARQRYGQVRMYLFSDHGMADVTSTSRLMLDMESLTRSTGLRFGHDYGAVYDSTMARFWFLNPQSEAIIREALAQRDDGRILSNQDLSEFGCRFAEREYGDLFFLLDPGVLLCPSHMGQRPLRGMHGYTPDHPDSTALVAATTPCVPPARLDGLFSLMLTEADRCGGRHEQQLARPLSQ